MSRHSEAQKTSAVTDLVNSDPASGPGHVKQSLQRSQAGNDVFHLAPRVRRAEEFHADPWQKKGTTLRATYANPADSLLLGRKFLTKYQMQPVGVDVLWTLGFNCRGGVSHRGGRGWPGQVSRGVI